MDDQNRITQMHKNGILIYQLPSVNVEEVLGCFPSGCIFYYFHDEEGLHIYFNDPDRVVQCVNDRVIELNDRYYNIYLLVTNMTLHGAATYTGDIKTLMESKGFENIIECYQAEHFVENEMYRSFIPLTDYRVILSVPEFLADCSLPPVTSLEHPGYDFRLSFFCRLCRRNGHKTFECQRYYPSDHSPFLRDFNPRSTRTNQTDRRISNVCSQSFASDSNHFHFFSSHPCSVKVEPHLDVMDTTLESNGNQVESKNMNSHSSLLRETSLSNGIKEAISMTRGFIRPEHLSNFLNHIRRRKDKKLVEITLSLTKHACDIPKLIKQLKLVEKNYYELVPTRGPSEDQDLRFLKNLQERLQKLIDLGSFAQREANNTSGQPSTSRFVGESSSSMFQSARTGLTDISSDSD